MKRTGKTKLTGLSLEEKRQFIRHSICFPLAYKVIENETTSPAGSGRGKSSESINISAGGLLFSAKRPVKAGSEIQIKIPFQDKVFSVQAKAVHCRKDSETKLYNIGARFSKLNAAFKVKLIEQLYLISGYRDLRSIQLGKDMSLEDASREWIKRYSARFRRLYW